MSQPIDLAQVEAGFADPVLDSQTNFRRILDTVSQPGRVETLELGAAPKPLCEAAAAFALCMLDADTPVYLGVSLDNDAVKAWLRFHCNCPLTATPGEAAFALLDAGDDWPVLGTFNAGDPKYPDESTTLVIQTGSIREGESVVIAGPGIETTSELRVTGLPETFWQDRAATLTALPLGLDVFLTADDQIIGLPRTTRRADEA